MKNEMVNAVRNFLARYEIDHTSDEEISKRANGKLNEILGNAQRSSENRTREIEAVSEFLKANDIQKEKLESYCLDFFDPTVGTVQTGINGEQIQQHKYLQEDELIKLYKFVKRHSADNTFGEVVFKVMDSHGMTPPEVYKNAQLRRQDFARATDVRTKSVTRQLAWQIIIGLHCSLDEADEVLWSTGYIRRSSYLDLTMEFFIRQKNYDVMAINDVLDDFGVKPFSCYKSVKDNDNM